MSVRIQVVIAAEERAAFRAAAEREGRSLSDWLREAGRARLADVHGPHLRTVEDLDAFFAECDAREEGREPDWQEHRRVIEESRVDGLPPVTDG